MSRLVVGLGNPGKCYEKTRHNFGFMVVREFAVQHGWPLKNGWRIKGELGRGTLNGETVHLLLPSTYMNLSGRALCQMMGYYKIPVDSVLVVVDDIHLSFGEMRARADGSCGGHNGLKSIEQALGTKKYARLRLGVGANSNPHKPLETYVLEDFSLSESEKLPELIKRGATLIESWIKHGIEECARKAGSFNNCE